jgi:hypothetical protein
MQIILTPQESEEYFYNALCNGLGYVQNYGLDLRYNSSEYKMASQDLQREDKDRCYEDVLMQMLKNGYTLTMVDVEGEGEYTRKITLQDVHSKVANTPLRHLLNMIDETDDAETADVILQTVFFDEIVFG